MATHSARSVRQGRDDRFRFPATRLTHADRNDPRATGSDVLPAAVARRTDFSFSGLKTAVLRLVQERLASRSGETLPTEDVADICASFQRVVVDTLLERTFEAAQWLGARSIGIAGGVSANSRLRADAEARGKRAGLPVFVPPIALSTDNAAMIGAAGLRRYRSPTISGSTPSSGRNSSASPTTSQRSCARAASTMGWCWCRRCTSQPAST